MKVVKEHASTVRNRTGKVRFAKAMPTTNPRTGMLWERDCSLANERGRIFGELGWARGKYGQPKNYAILYFSVAYADVKFPLVKIQID